MIIPAPLPQIVDYTKRGSFSLTESDIIATGSLPADADINNFKKFGFAEKQLDEAQAFLKR